MIHIAFVMEIGLGHTTHYENLRAAVKNDPEIEATFIPIRFEGDFLAKIPKLRNDIALRAGVQANWALARLYSRKEVDVLFFHTHLPSVLSHSYMRRTPAAISIDATPMQFAALGKYYGFQINPNSMQAKRNHAWSLRAFQSARRIVAFSKWAGESAVKDYGVRPENVEVHPSAVDISLWTPSARTPSDEVRLLFVGGQLGRKGGDLLLRWMQDKAPENVSLDVVTRGETLAAPRVRVHRDLNSNDPRLIELFRQADIFVLPTRADCSPFVLIEAMAAGVPVLSTRMAGIPEIVTENRTGMLCEPDDYESFSATLTNMIADSARLNQMSVYAREDAEARYDIRNNVKDLLISLKKLAADPARR